ncbi:DUF885 domain-containing protein [Nonomuraea soli]|uniref:Uncharacterized protein (DUF885 family) n=1 Tax=Nonomuraea soli TaxID=1032476 RepID=A0A7W0HS60_9ACTN|nr:DUF885 domain-containing protein [Nonomuraea soli]MBA2893680.1 uncharacterized protein (DUF885 family) [Nonomuraea soli]
MDEFLTWYFSRNPIAATLLGAEGHSHTLGDYSAEGLTAYEREQAGWLERLTAVEGGTLDDRIDRGLVMSQLRGDLALSSWPWWRRDPTAYLGGIFSSLFVPFQRALQPEAVLVDAAVAQLAEIPGVLAACRTNLDPELAADLYVKRALGQARTGRGLVTSTIPAMITSDDLRARFLKAAEPAADAFDSFVAFLEGFEARGSWRMGEKLYSTLLLEREMLGYGAADLHAKGREQVALLDGEMREVSRRFNGSPDWHAALNALADDHPPTLEAMRAEYDAETQRARAWVRANDLVTFAEGEECHVLPSAEYNRPILAVAHYVSPPPLTSSRVGYFFVPYTPDGFTPEQVRQRLRTNARAMMPSVAVHEAYPGHHWHLSYMAGNPRTVRKVFRTPYFSEGWALYVEKVAHEHGYFDTPATELGYLDARIFRAARIVVDTALHCEDMSVEEAESYMLAHSGLTEETAKGEVNRYCAWPTQAPSYLTGALEIERIRGSFKGSLKEFHDRIAGSGGLPLGLAEQAALA